MQGFRDVDKGLFDIAIHLRADLSYFPFTSKKPAMLFVFFNDYKEKASTSFLLSALLPTTKSFALFLLLLRASGSQYSFRF